MPTYVDLPTGERDKNLRQVIECYSLALEVCTREAFPQEWTESQRLLGIALCAMAPDQDCETLVLYRKRALTEQEHKGEAVWRAFDKAA